jgi:hypothetical protein
MYELCPLKFKLVRLDKEDDVSGISEVLVYGNYVHYANETWLKERIDPGAAFAKTTERMLKEYPQNMVFSVLDKATKGFFWCVDEVLKMMHQIGKDSVVYLTEKYFKVDNGYGQQISGKADLIIYDPANKVAKVIDFKGGNKAPNKAQLVFYDWYVRNKWPGVQVEAMFMWFSKKRIITEIITEQYRSTVARRVQDMFIGIDGGKYEPCPGKPERDLEAKR